jgi:hypothetical protein
LTEPRYRDAVHRLCEIHRQDPEGAALAYHEALHAWVLRLRPEAPVALQLAAFSQHLRRFASPRSEFPAGRAGYRRWRTTLAQRHADEAAAVLEQVGWDEATVARVRQLVLKQGLGRDPDVGTLEDAVCLVFLAQQLEAFAALHPPDKVVDILRKTWAKMTPLGQAAAPEVVEGLAAPIQALVAQATREPPAR